MTNTNYIPSVEEEAKTCCDTGEIRAVSMAESLFNAQDSLVHCIALIEELDRFIFHTDVKQGSEDGPRPECMRDSIYMNEYLACRVEALLKSLVNRVCS